jgi:hypothetical protein
MAILDFLGGLVKPVFGLIDNLTGGNDIEKQKLSNAVTELQSKMGLKLIELESQLIEARSSIIRAEAEGKSVLQRIWRPVIMLTFAGVIVYTVVAPAFGAPPVDMSGVPEKMWNLLIIGIGGYIGGRTLEKIIPNSKWGKLGGEKM